MLNTIMTYFSNDPLRILYLLGGSGGLYFWIRQYLDRVRVDVILLGEEPKLLRFEVTNLGDKPTSIKYIIKLKAYRGNNRRPEEFDLKIDTSERRLLPHDPKRFEAKSNKLEDFACLNFKTYTFSFSKGRQKRVRSLYLGGGECPVVAFLWCWLWRQLFGRFPKSFGK